MSDNDRIAAHYARERIAERLLGALAAAGVDVSRPTPLDLAPLDQFHGRGLEATKELAQMLDPKAEERILDIGSGLGGPARFIAFTYGATVDGIDLTAEFVAAAEELTLATGLAGQVRFARASALELPFEDASFDAAYSQNVVMNVADKAAFYAEAGRVLKPGGRLALSNLALGEGGPPSYPTPWAATAEASFLSTPDETRRQIEAAGFTIEVFRVITAQYLRFYEATRERARREGPPALGLHLVMGERFAEVQRNSARNIEQGRVLPLEILCRKR